MQDFKIKEKLFFRKHLKPNLAHYIKKSIYLSSDEFLL